MALVGLVVVSHSRPLAEAAVELSLQMLHGPRPEIVIAAGTRDGRFGTDATRVAEALRAADGGAGVVVLMDLGSAVLSAEFAMDLVEDVNAILVAAPFVEGLLAAAVRSATGGTLEEVADEARAALAPKLSALGMEPHPDDEPAEETGEILWVADAETRVTLHNASGLHARPAALLVAAAREFDAEVRLRCHGLEGGATSPIALATLNARQGDEVWIGARGPQAAEAVTALASLIADGFGELARPPGPTVVTPTGPLGVSPGRVVGPARLMAAPLVDPPMESRLRTSQLPGEKNRLMAALEEVAADYEARADDSGDDAAQIMRATATLTRDPELLRSAQALMEALHVGAATAMWRTTNDIVERLHAAGGLLAERTTDITDIRDRVVCRLTDRPMPGIPESGEPFVLVAQDLAPSDTASLERERCLGIVTVDGGPTSHTSVLARSMGIPAVVGFRDALAIPDGAEVLVDGASGEVIVSPDEAQRAGARTTPCPLEPLSAPGVTRDGFHVPLLANVGSVSESRAAARAGAEGVGLFRTEICFLDAEVEPDLEQQFATYRDALAQFPGRRVVVRTLDAGSDKPMPFLTMPGEENPALGVRGYRTTIRSPGVLARQLEAIARAARASDAEVWVMAPMISTPAEAGEFAELARAAGLGPVGVMVEIPSAALQAEEILAEVDFVSIGTNDLAQYAMATDRQATGLGDLQDIWQPAVLRLLRMVGRAGRRTGKPVGVCGEAAADPALAAVLVGFGVTSLSMALRALEPVRRTLARVTVEDCRRAAEAALTSSGPAAARKEVSRILLPR
ncbi:phosphoenolpyruvate--protein phosphotransferase [[Pseudopropionibacterium] massiliense]|uniref:phosphoenolpyruvate--protein phosphotransferase n=1 Tax=[Pseudopropionibacterium] massiliense TaxID=2220000 RepID=UPI001031F604|nr:phosphoenolpyruvate--protein phosphotransferase [[Pseudopropionibacterium] massiliense]